MADFVATGKIVKVYPNESSEEIYRADIKIENLVKGPMISSIYVRGRSDGKMGSSCAIFTPENSEYIFFGTRDQSGRISYGACSGTRDLGYIKEKSPHILDLVELLKKEKDDYSGHPNIMIRSGLDAILESHKGQYFEEKFALYEVQFEENLKVEKVRILKGFGNGADDKIVNGLVKAIWKNHYAENQARAPKGTKKLIAIYFYAADDKYPSFLSEYDL